MKTLIKRRACLAALFCSTLLPSTLPAVDLFTGHRQRPQKQELWARTELYFGSDKHDGTVVTREEFMQFVDREITPRFPDGLTLLTGYGQFLDSRGVIEKERSMVLILLYPLTSFDSSKKIQEIRQLYKDCFRQESVLRVDSVSHVSF
ncbi:MAG TPA: DUF3574 domain-containing protein [Bryobacteraceae bacterium]|jgi:hypothetical protein